MTLNEVTTPRQHDDADWQFERVGLLTSSSFAAAAGISPYKSRIELWKELTGRKKKEKWNQNIQHGIDCEPIAIADYEAQTGKLVTSCGFIKHPSIEWLGASPDGLIPDGIIECKCPAQGSFHETVPEHYMSQVQGGLEITGRKYCDFFSWIAGQLKIIPVYRDLNYWTWLLPLLEEFWDYVKNDIEPPRLKAKPFYK